MGKSIKYILISDFHLNESNRGTAALAYGAINFLKDRGFLTSNKKIATLSRCLNPFKKNNKSKTSTFVISGEKIEIFEVCVTMLEYNLYFKYGLLLPFTTFARFIRNLAMVAAINGGDGFSDIYGDKLFNLRLPDIKLSMKKNLPLVLLPQTIGPFNTPKAFDLAKQILKYAQNVYVRDAKYVGELDKIGVQYEITKDLSAYMLPEKWDIDLPENSVGINVSGLAYYNNFFKLKGQFDVYPNMILSLINKFLSLGEHVVLIPHSYNYSVPEENNDDLKACRDVYEKYKNNKNVILIDKDLKSPQVKYVISKMQFFCGTRMHANFAAIYTDVPVFGLAYSYKFAGAFEANGLSSDHTYMINNMSSTEIEPLINKIVKLYKNTKDEKNEDNCNVPSTVSLHP